MAIFGPALLSGCGYQWGNLGSELPGGHSSIAVPVFENRTHETGIEVFFTNAAKREFQRSDISELKAQEKAEITLEGVVETINYVHSAQIAGGGSRKLPDQTVLTTEYRILVTALLQVRRLKDKKILWSGRFQGERSYTAPQVETPGVNSVNPLYNHSARYQNITRLAEDMMAEAYVQMTGAF